MVLVFFEGDERGVLWLALLRGEVVEFALRAVDIIHNHVGQARHQLLGMHLAEADADAAFSQALAAVGKPAVESLVQLLCAPSEWTRVNAAFALGEMDSHAGAAVPALVEALGDASHRVVRTAIDALGNIAASDPQAGTIKR